MRTRTKQGCYRCMPDPILTFVSGKPPARRSEEHTSELQSQSNLVCRLLLEKEKKHTATPRTGRPRPPPDGTLASFRNPRPASPNSRAQADTSVPRLLQ